MQKIMTLCLIHKGDKILLGMKKRGFGQGRWNGFGGKIQEGETIEQAAIRETKEEAGLDIVDMENVGFINFSWKDKEDSVKTIFFKVTNYTGDPIETEEMKPQWFDIKDIPYESMWQDDKYWLPLFLQGKKFEGKFVFDDADKILEQELKEI